VGVTEHTFSFTPAVVESAINGIYRPDAEQGGSEGRRRGVVFGSECFLVAPAIQVSNQNFIRI
jgi:hypothetical protein